MEIPYQLSLCWKRRTAGGAHRDHIGHIESDQISI